MNVSHKLQKKKIGGGDFATFRKLLLLTGDWEWYNANALHKFK